ncbi:putative zinc-binding metallopeptidase [Paracoccus sp. (in: a-proteobacteria)]|uniref:zinc-binding metallopeptidase family protein n=1 Tax=Paracoccus sp. TaxID=267 RepID=UPI0026E01933|nr:putative zinc-binding metallopeptidase [Paracoccus sp. (in: a-proteobacteria)]MDO5646836.1 putative zinc-binding metallopeptidase [Paracoccus sp. (in: a-proteobacteria)]
MQRFSCPNCGAHLYFHNLACLCGCEVAFDPEAAQMQPLTSPCANRDALRCNWAGDGALCRSCAMSQVVPVLHVGDNEELLARAERAKRWVLANLARWNWFTDADTGRRPHFLMLSEDTGGRSQQIIMGHAAGEITINVTEADALIRLQRQQDLGEQYRSMVGHFRHELAHFLFDRLAVADGFLDDFRAVFGDERADYGAALQRHYAEPRDPGAAFITPYATAHPHEDWAETVAHLLHLVDFTDSFVSAGLSMAGVPDGYDPYTDADTPHLLLIASEVAIAVNDINRALDNNDLYPFVLTTEIRAKIAFAHGWLRDHIQRGG